jgi:hypothetical protein
MDFIGPLLFLYFQRMNKVRGHNSAFFYLVATGKDALHSAREA